MGESQGHTQADGQGRRAAPANIRISDAKIKQLCVFIIIIVIFPRMPVNVGPPMQGKSVKSNFENKILNKCVI
jgi:hypothetical protein